MKKLFNNNLFFIGWSLVTIFFISGCSNFLSSSDHDPLVMSDREAAKNASNNISEVASIYYEFGNRKPFIINVIFDGTGNDKDSIDASLERDTVAGLLYKKMFLTNNNTIYFSGPGVNSKMDAAKCFSCIPKANMAMNYVENILKKNGAESYDYRVVVIGFSRGAAIGRHFMNLMNDKWSGDNVSVRSYAILFDTVATGQLNNLRLGMSATTDYLVHIVSRDERRNTLFGVVKDRDVYFEVDEGEGFRKSIRFLELTVPGVHSDIGGTYINGIGSMYRVLAEEILFEMGILSINQWVLEDGVFDYGMHDSRGVFDKLLFVKSFTENPDSTRKDIVVDSEWISISQRQEIINRSKSSLEAKFSIGNLRSKWKSYGFNLESARFNVVNLNGRLKFISTSNWINQDSIFFDSEKRRLSFEGYEFNGLVPKSSIVLLDDVFFAFLNSDFSNFEVVVSAENINLKKKYFINFYINGRRIYKLNANSNHE